MQAIFQMLLGGLDRRGVPSEPGTIQWDFADAEPWHLVVANGAPPRDPATMALLFDMLRRGIDHRHAPAGPVTLQWDFPDAEPWHLRVDNGSTAVAPGFAADAEVVFKVRYEDFVDVFAGRLDARKAVMTGRLRPRGSLRALWSTRRLFG